MAAVSKAISGERVAAGLNRWAAAQDAPVRAAVTLLIENGWHRIPVFRRVMLSLPVPDGDLYVIRWSVARNLFDDDAFVGIGGSRAGEILDFAIALGENRFSLNLQGPNAAGEMIEAFAHALGATRVEYSF